MSLPYPVSVRSERIADNAVHVAGLIVGLAGSVALIVYVALVGSGAEIAGAAVYAAATMLALSMSAAYHLAPSDAIRPWLRRLDHAAIYVKIAGTYTPLVVILGGIAAYGLLAAVWIMALAGAAAKLIFWRVPGRRSTLLYIALGWLGLALAWPMYGAVPGEVLALMGAGGATYTAGAWVYGAQSLPFNTAIWHVMVLIATACFFVAVALGVGG